MARSFAERWARKERELGMAAIAAKMVRCGSDYLPDSAAPCLTFDRASKPAAIWTVFGSPVEWSAIERKRLAKYKMIGSDGAANPICIEEPTGTVLLLDHENRFRSVQFVNTNVSKLAECLLAYMGQEDGDSFRSAVAKIDPPAIAEKTFWWHEANFVGK
jgi:hypothetical protein